MLFNESFDFFSTHLVQNPTQEIRQKRINFNDFESIKIIGRGAFGTVDLVRLKLSGQLYAMKTLSKFEMVNIHQIQEYISNRFSFIVVKTFG